MYAVLRLPVARPATSSEQHRASVVSSVRDMCANTLRFLDKSLDRELTREELLYGYRLDDFESAKSLHMARRLRETSLDNLDNANI